MDGSKFKENNCNFFTDAGPGPHKIASDEKTT